MTNPLVRLSCIAAAVVAMTLGCVEPTTASVITPTVTMSAPATVSQSTAFTVKGTVSDLSPGSTVQLQRHSDASWVKVASTRTSEAGLYRFTGMTIESAGTFSLRAKARTVSGTSYVTAYSEPSSIEVVTTKRSLTLSVPTGAEVGTQPTFAGQLSNSPPGSPVRLQRRSGASWKTIAKTSTDEAGNFSVSGFALTKMGTFKFRALAPTVERADPPGTLAASKSSKTWIVVSGRTESGRAFVKGTSSVSADRLKVSAPGSNLTVLDPELETSAWQSYADWINAGFVLGSPFEIQAPDGLPAAGITITKTYPTPLPKFTTALLAEYDPESGEWVALPSKLADDRLSVTAIVQPAVSAAKTTTADVGPWGTNIVDVVGGYSDATGKFATRLGQRALDLAADASHVTADAATAAGRGIWNGLDAAAFEIKQWQDARYDANFDPDCVVQPGEANTPPWVDSYYLYGGDNDLPVHWCVKKFPVLASDPQDTDDDLRISGIVNRGYPLTYVHRGGDAVSVDNGYFSRDVIERIGGVSDWAGEITTMMAQLTKKGRVAFPGDQVTFGVDPAAYDPNRSLDPAVSGAPIVQFKQPSATLAAFWGVLSLISDQILPDYGDPKNGKRAAGAAALILWASCYNAYEDGNTTKFVDCFTELLGVNNSFTDLLEAGFKSVDPSADDTKLRQLSKRLTKKASIIFAVMPQFIQAGDRLVDAADNDMKAKLAVTLYTSIGGVPPSTWEQTTAGYLHACGIRTSRTLWCWGDNESFQPGDGTNRSQPTPIQIDTNAWKQVTAGNFYTCGIQTDDTLWCWGNNGWGELGIGSLSHQPTPTQVGSGTWKYVAAKGHTCGIRTDDTLWCWGQNYKGRLGDGTATNRTSPTPVSSGRWTQVALGVSHTCGIRTDATLWCWGEGGLLGDGTSTTRYLPTQVGASTWKQVSADYSHTCGIQTDDSLWCWGNNNYGKLGDGTEDPRLAPTKVGTESWRHVEAADEYTCGLKVNSTLWCWGDNSSSVMADGTVHGHILPTKVGSDTWSQISTNDEFRCGLHTDASAWCWGRDDFGQLGNGTTDFQWYPAPVGP